jgi:hypothetical protein
MAALEIGPKTSGKTGRILLQGSIRNALYVHTYNKISPPRAVRFSLVAGQVSPLRFLSLSRGPRHPIASLLGPRIFAQHLQQWQHPAAGPSPGSQLCLPWLVGVASGRGGAESSRTGGLARGGRHADSSGVCRCLALSGGGQGFWADIR